MSSDQGYKPVLSTIRLEIHVELVDAPDPQALEDELYSALEGPVSDAVNEFIAKHSDVYNDTEGWGFG